MWTDIILGLFAAIVFLYAGLQLGFTLLFIRKGSTTLSPSKGHHQLSILIPFRNEAHTLEHCVHSILRQLNAEDEVEILLLDDHSEDGSTEIARSIAEGNVRVRWIPSVQEGKKRALELGNQEAVYPWVFTADADCTYEGVRFLDLVNHARQKKWDVLTLPVWVRPERTWVGRYQFWDSVGLMLITAVTLRMNGFLSASGAALLYRREDFLRIQPYRDNIHIASGDDQFLLYAFRQKGCSVIRMMTDPRQKVWTQAAPNWRQMLQQRLRWASKSQNLKDIRLDLTLQLSVAANVVFILLLGWLVFKFRIIYGFLGVLVVKWAVEVFLLLVAAHYWQLNKEAKGLLVNMLIHPWVVVAIVANYVLRKQIKWKERYIKHN